MNQARKRFIKTDRHRGKLLLAVSLVLYSLLLVLAVSFRPKADDQSGGSVSELSAEFKSAVAGFARIRPQNNNHDSRPSNDQLVGFFDNLALGSVTQISEIIHSADTAFEKEKFDSAFDKLEPLSEQELTIESKRKTLLERQLLGWSAAKSPQFADQMELFLKQGREYNLSSSETGLLILESLTESIDRDDYRELLYIVRSAAEADMSFDGSISVADNSLIEKDVAYYARILKLSPEQAEVYRRLSLEARDRFESAIGLPQGTTIPAADEAVLNSALKNEQEIFRTRLTEILNPDQIQAFLTLQQK